MSDESRPVRRVAVVTGSRAEYGLLRPVMDAIKDEGLELQLVVTGMHLMAEFGESVLDIEGDGYAIDARVPMATATDDHGERVQALAAGIAGLGLAIGELDPDVVLVLGDRVEAFAAAIVGAGLNRVVAHIHGGDVTRGGLDESMRHAITKLAHVHFVATAESGRRVAQMGEEAHRIHVVGAPGLDVIPATPALSIDQLEREVGVSLRRPFIVLVQHPVSTTADLAATEMFETLAALEKVALPTVCLYPNSDPGGRRIIEVIRSYADQPWFHVVRNLRSNVYIELIRACAVLVGNTSSGIIEAPTLRTPVVNIGIRQAGRERAANVIDVPPDRDQIFDAVSLALSSPAFQEQVRTCTSPYGDGTAGRRIARVLSTLQIDTSLLQKQLAC